MGTLYECKSGNHQGLIVEEETGRTVAVTYDKADAEPIIRAVNSHAELLAACENALAMPDGVPVAEWNAVREQLRVAIAKATA